MFSQGASLQELEENIRDAYELMMEEGEVLPQPGVRTRRRRASPPPRMMQSLGAPKSSSKPTVTSPQCYSALFSIPQRFR